MTLITGNTYPVKDQIRAMGGIWQPRAKGWLVPDSAVAAAEELVENATAQPQPRKSGGRGVYTRFAGGGEHYRNRAGRCEDAPCCGCCS